MNTLPETSANQDDSAGSVSNAQDDNAMRNSNALRSTGKLKIGHCLQCGVEFEKRTTWQKYCHELCRIKAHELRTGKTWRGKKLETA